MLKKYCNTWCIAMPDFLLTKHMEYTAAGCSSWQHPITSTHHVVENRDKTDSTAFTSDRSPQKIWKSSMCSLTGAVLQFSTCHDNGTLSQASSCWRYTTSIVCIVEAVCNIVVSPITSKLLWKTTTTANDPAYVLFLPASSSDLCNC